MKYSADKKTDNPAYMQIYIRLREDIVKGVYSYGEKLPSKRVIAADFGVSVITAEHSFGILADEGYIEARERQGYFVIYRDGDAFPVASSERDIPREVTNHRSSGEFFPFSVLAKTFRTVLSEYDSALLVKSPGFGCRELQRAVSAYLARSRNMDVSPSQIVIGSGAEYLYGIIVQLLGRERIFALEDPSYEKIHKVYTSLGVSCRMLKMGAEGIKSDELRNTDATVLHITPFNSYPSGVTATASKRGEYIRWAKERGGYIVEDDFDSEFSVSTKTEDTVFSLDPDGAVIYLNTFSKTIAPSMRIGYMVLPDRLLKELKEKLGFYSCTVPLFEQLVIARIINNGDFERHINRVRRMRRKNSTAH